MLQFDDVREIIIKGCGAKYLDLKTLKNMQIPIDLFMIFPQQYKQFVTESDEQRKVIVKQVSFKLLNMSKSAFESKTIIYQGDRIVCNSNFN
ncbi:hypothetical protein CWC18_20830 [Pseudoalteromonas aurantia]|uniref:Uncharacterized protein n=1 Tax=Pseudoalteromonas aurantia TaxID=43654 RepID=A0ABY2VS47_9GAMM|nr:hypothetical protein CWC18_20830 [Pseudoalteromonas aurantia]TMO69349.1 hypothetical protein CWC20_20720 [Pseudoalteromonas aurantia]